MMDYVKSLLKKSLEYVEKIQNINEENPKSIKEAAVNELKYRKKYRILRSINRKINKLLNKNK